MNEQSYHLIGTGHLFRKEKKCWLLLASKSSRRVQLMNMIGISPLFICPSLFEENLNKADFPNAELYVLETAFRKGDDIVQRIWGNAHQKETQEMKNEKEDTFKTVERIEKEHIENIPIDALTYCSNITNKEISLSANPSECFILDPLPKVIISSDTIVTLNDEIIEKPKNRKHAFEMLKKLSGKVHTVYTAVCIFVYKKKEPVTFVEKTDVYFDELSDKDIQQYLNLNEAYDKAGGYGIQGFGAEFIKKIDGCFYNVMGLPIRKLSKMLADLHEKGYYTFE